MKSQVKHILQAGSSSADPWTVKDLAAVIRARVSHDTVPNVRKLIRELIEDGHPIASNERGYYWCERRADMEDYTASLQSRIDAIHKRLLDFTKAYEGAQRERHKNIDLPYKDRCRYYVIYLAESTGIPYQAIWSLAYRKFSRYTKVDTVNLPAWYKGSTLNYIDNLDMAPTLYLTLTQLEDALA